MDKRFPRCSLEVLRFSCLFPFQHSNTILSAFLSEPSDPWPCLQIHPFQPSQSQQTPVSPLGRPAGRHRCDEVPGELDTYANTSSPDFTLSPFSLCSCLLPPLGGFDIRSSSSNSPARTRRPMPQSHSTLYRGSSLASFGCLYNLWNKVGAPSVGCQNIQSSMSDFLSHD